MAASVEVWKAAQPEAQMISRDAIPEALDTRLTEATEHGQTVEVILVLRGRVRPVAGGRRWRIRVEGGRVVTFAGEWVVAATPVAPRGSCRR